MRIDLATNRILYDYLNTTFFPYRYKDMARLAAFQNRVLRKFAAVHHLEFLEVAGMMPHDPGLFGDAIHANYPGVRLHGWIVAQQLAPILSRRIAEGRLPRPFRSGLTRHPAFPGNERTATVDCDRTSELARLNFQNAALAVPPSMVVPGSVLEVRIPTDTPRFSYAAMVGMPSYVRPDKGGLILAANVEVSGGDISVGVLSADQRRFLVQEDVKPTQGAVPIRLTVGEASEGLGPLVISAGKGSTSEVSVKMSDARILSMENYLQDYGSGLLVPEEH
jgi:hypothetical protein